MFIGMKGLLTIIVMVIAAHCFAQSNFQRLYGGSGDDRGHAVITTSDGGFAIAGSTTSYGEGGTDLFILKLTTQGVPEWQKAYGGVQYEGGMSIALMETPGRELVVTGTTQSFGGTLRNLFVFKTDAQGTLLWSGMYDSGPVGSVLTSDLGRGLLFTKDGDILITGTDDAHTFGSNDALAIKLDISGNLIWRRVYGGSGQNDHFHQSVELPSGNVITAGSSQAFGPGPRGAYLVKLDTDGNVIWGKTYGGNREDLSGYIDMASPSEIIATGHTSSFGSGQNDILLFKVDTAGALIWSRTYGRSGDERGVSVKSFPDGSGYLVCAVTNSFGQGEDILLIRTDTDGSVIWSRTFDSGDDDTVDNWAGSSLDLIGNNGFLVTGWSDGLSAVNTDILLLKSDAEGRALCGDVNLNVSTPNLQIVNTSTFSGVAGSYISVNSPSGTAAFEVTELCHCIPDSVCNECSLPEIDIDVAGNIDCVSDSVVVSLSGSTGMPDLLHTWYDSAFILIDAGASLTVHSAGLYFIVTTDTLTSCERMDSFMIEDLREALEVDAGENQQIDCRQDTVDLVPVIDDAQLIDFLWSGPPGGLASDPSFEIAQAASGGMYVLSVTDKNTGCTGTDSVLVEDIRVIPVADAGSDGEINCTGDTIVLDGSASSAGPGFSYSWNGPGVTGTGNVMTTVQTPGWYFLEVMHTLSGCTALDSAEVTALQTLEADLLVSGPPCPEDSSGQIQVAVVSGGTLPYTYSLDGIIFQLSPEFIELPPGDYAVIVADSAGCLLQMSAHIPEPPMIDVFVGADTILEIGQYLQLSPEITSSIPVDSIVWDPEENLSCAMCTGPVFHAGFADTFQISATVYAGGCVATDALLIFVPEVFELFVPNVFSPNNDGINDFVTVFSNDMDALVLEFEIFDRWGELIFKNTGFRVNQLSEGWDGTFRGKAMNPGVFVCVVKVLLSNQSTQVISADVTLVR